VEPGEERCRAGSVEALVVVEDANLQIWHSLLDKNRKKRNC
jgi:hypothetical protein